MFLFGSDFLLGCGIGLFKIASAFEIPPRAVQSGRAAVAAHPVKDPLELADGAAVAATAEVVLFVDEPVEKQVYDIAQKFSVLLSPSPSTAARIRLSESAGQYISRPSSSLI